MKMSSPACYLMITTASLWADEGLEGGGDGGNMSTRTQSSLQPISVTPKTTKLGDPFSNFIRHVGEAPFS